MASILRSVNRGRTFQCRKYSARRKEKSWRSVLTYPRRSWNRGVAEGPWSMQSSRWRISWLPDALGPGWVVAPGVEVTSGIGCCARVVDASVVLLLWILRNLCLAPVMRPCKPSVRALPKWYVWSAEDCSSLSSCSTAPGSSSV